MTSKWNYTELFSVDLPLLLILMKDFSNSEIHSESFEMDVKEDSNHSDEWSIQGNDRQTGISNTENGSQTLDSPSVSAS